MSISMKGFGKPKGAVMVIDDEEAVPNCPEHGGTSITASSIKIDSNGTLTASVKCNLCDWTFEKGNPQ